jgi:hypothetical protein
MTLPYFVFAQSGTVSSSSNPVTMLENIASGNNGPYTSANEDSLPTILGNIINGALILLGVIFIVLMIISGYNWMTASGNQEKVGKAKDLMINAVIGLIIVMAAYAITAFVGAKLT